MSNAEYVPKVQNNLYGADVNNNILIIADGGTYKHAGEIINASDEMIKNCFSDSELESCYNTAKNIGVSDIYIINAPNKYNYMDVTDYIKNYDFAYVVPIGINFSDTFYSNEYNAYISYATYYMYKICAYNDTTVIMTDSHASLYDDLDDFLNDMSKKISDFKHSISSNLNFGRNMCICANNLKNYKYANLILASVLASGAYNSYPDFSSFGPAVFDIDDSDLNCELIYFKNNSMAGTSVENLYNFYFSDSAVKLMLVDRVIKYIGRNLNFPDFSGKYYNTNIENQVKTCACTFLNRIKGDVISDYNIASVKYVHYNSSPSGYIQIDFYIIPCGFDQPYRITMHV